jgi:hypothetical protein
MGLEGSIAGVLKGRTVARWYIWGDVVLLKIVFLGRFFSVGWF